MPCGGPCAWCEFTVHLSDVVRQALPPDHAFRDKGHLVSDVAVLSEVFMPSEPLPRAYRLEVAPPPLPVLEVLSKSTGRSDLGPKLDTCAAMGIAEYWRTTRRAKHRRHMRTVFRSGAGGPGHQNTAGHK